MMTTNNVLKNQQNFNVSEGNVKENDISLTELWKKGELPTGIYYIIDYEDLEVIDEYVNGFGFVKFEPKQVLAPVPSYKEWQQMKAFCEEFNALNVAEENQQLKELLLKCREKLDELDYGCEIWQGELTGFIEEIDEALK